MGDGSLETYTGLGSAQWTWGQEDPLNRFVNEAKENIDSIWTAFAPERTKDTPGTFEVNLKLAGEQSQFTCGNEIWEGLTSTWSITCTGPDHFVYKISVGMPNEITTDVPYSEITNGMQASAKAYVESQD